METGVLYSGGKDSSLAAVWLDDRCDVTLLCCTFGITTDYEHAAATGRELGFATQRVDLDIDIAQAAAEQIVDDGYPRHGIQRIHEHALERCAGLDVDGIADGTRRDDRVPRVERSLAQSLEDRYDISYLAPLAGIGRTAVDSFVADLFTVETGPSPTIDKGDYETELRALIRDEYGSETVQDCFPDHSQSRVTGWQ
jgi:predicted subunit of tRNA(5-methylaminomethyl-2-thiouridylate) methyltransferase